MVAWSLAWRLAALKTAHAMCRRLFSASKLSDPATPARLSPFHGMLKLALKLLEGFYNVFQLIDGYFTFLLITIALLLQDCQGQASGHRPFDTKPSSFLLMLLIHLFLSSPVDAERQPLTHTSGVG
eukprot:4735472-Amphidinium_carterae.1